MPPPPPSVDTTKTRSDPQRAGMYNSEMPIGAAKGKQTNTMASCQPEFPQPLLMHPFAHQGKGQIIKVTLARRPEFSWTFARMVSAYRTETILGFGLGNLYQANSKVSMCRRGKTALGFGFGNLKQKIFKAKKKKEPV